jgi:succinate dehydrogenase / fumarate reductase cytochrome b subunit
MTVPQRPLSPFLIYRWGVTNTLSILHRITGVLLALGLFFLALWLLALASGPEAYAGIVGFYDGAWFSVLLAGWAFCFFYHLANGIRHLIWDAGYGFERGQVRLGGIAVVVFAIVATGFYIASAIV